MSLREKQFMALEQIWNAEVAKLPSLPPEKRQVLCHMLLNFHDALASMIEHGRFDPEEDAIGLYRSDAVPAGSHTY